MSKSLIDRILQDSNVIHNSNLRGISNWIITISITNYLSDIKRNWRKVKWVYKNIFNINKTEIRRYKFNDNSGFR